MRTFIWVTVWIIGLLGIAKYFSCCSVNYSTSVWLTIGFCMLFSLVLYGLKTALNH